MSHCESVIILMDAIFRVVGILNKYTIILTKLHGADLKMILVVLIVPFIVNVKPIVVTLWRIRPIKSPSYETLVTSHNLPQAI